jgi:hypothetical protein
MKFIWIFVIIFYAKRRKMQCVKIAEDILAQNSELHFKKLIWLSYTF